MMKTNGRLIIICGLPGSGKTTLARKLEADKNAIRFCPDEWMDDLALNLWDEDRRGKIEELQWKFAQELLTRRLTVIIEWGTWARSERDSLRERAKSLGAANELHYLAASAEILFDRIQRRKREDPPIKHEDVLQWFSVFQEPTSEELKLFDEAKIISVKSSLHEN